MNLEIFAFLAKLQFHVTNRLKLVSGLIVACIIIGLAILFLSPKPSAESIIQSVLPAGATKIHEEQDGPNLWRVYDLPVNYTEADAFYNNLFNLEPGDPQVTVRGTILPGLLDQQTICSASAGRDFPLRVILKSTPKSLLTVLFSAPAKGEPARLVVSCLMSENREPSVNLAMPVAAFTLPVFSFTNATMHSSVTSQRISAYNLRSNSTIQEVASFYSSQTNPPFKTLTIWTNKPVQAAIFHRLNSNGLELATFYHTTGSTNTSIQAIRAH